MTTVAVLVDPPREGLVLSELVETSPLSATEAADCYAAMARDVFRAVDASGGDLLVNFRPDDALPPAYRAGDDAGGSVGGVAGGGDSEADTEDDAIPSGAADADAEDDAIPSGAAEREVRDLLDGAVADPDDVRLEVQVGETFAGRVGNTVTHLLEREGVDTAAAVTPAAAFLGRQHVDSAAMKLRRSEVVLGPAGGGRVYYAGFRDTVDFTDAYATPAVGTLARRGRDAGHDVDFLPVLPVLETGRDLADALALAEARRAADKTGPLPTETLGVLDELGVHVTAGDDGLELVRG